MQWVIYTYIFYQMHIHSTVPFLLYGFDHFYSVHTKTVTLVLTLPITFDIESSERARQLDDGRVGGEPTHL